MQNDPTHFACYEAMRDADEALEDELSHVRAEQDAHRVTPVEAAAERVGLLERHLAKCKWLRRELLSGS